MRPNFFPPYFVVTFVAVTLAAALIWLDTFRGYEGEATALILERTERGATATQTLIGLTKTLPFYDRVLLSNEMLDDPTKGLTPDVRKSRWNDMMRVLPSGGGVITIQAQGATQADAKNLVQATVATLFETASLYYNVKTDIDIRLIESDLVRPRIANKTLWVFVSMLSGVAVTGMFFVILGLLDRWIFRQFPNQHRRADAVDSEALFTPETFKPVPPTHFPVQEERTEYIAPAVPEDELRVTLETAYPPMPQPKAVAPSNLPVLEEESDLPPLLEAQARLIKEDVAATVESRDVVLPPDQPKTGEPTPEEYKRRLNALLTGE